MKYQRAKQALSEHEVPLEGINSKWEEYKALI